MLLAQRLLETVVAEGVFSGGDGALANLDAFAVQLDDGASEI